MALKNGSEAVMSFMEMERQEGRIPIQETISMDKTKTAISRLKIRKATEVDDITIKMLKSGHDVVAE